jgi:hypothetical protein
MSFARLRLALVTSLCAFSVVFPTMALAQGPFDRQNMKSPDLGVDIPAASGLSRTDVRVVVARIIRVGMGLLGMIAVVIVMYGGFLWMTAGGNDEQVGEAKKWLMGGVIGLIIILSAFALSTFVINSLVNVTTSGESTIPFE